jgi:hypothetical protein
VTSAQNFDIDIGPAVVHFLPLVVAESRSKPPQRQGAAPLSAPLAAPCQSLTGRREGAAIAAAEGALQDRALCARLPASILQGNGVRSLGADAFHHNLCRARESAKEMLVILVAAQVGPFRSLNTAQTVKIDPAVTVLVGMNEAGKTVLLKALHKSAAAVGGDKFDVVEDYPRKDLTAYQKRHKTEPAAAVVLTYALEDAEVEVVNKKLSTDIKPGQLMSITHKYNNVRSIGLPIDELPTVQALARAFSTDAQSAVKDCKSVRKMPERLANMAVSSLKCNGGELLATELREDFIRGFVS